MNTEFDDEIDDEIEEALDSIEKKHLSIEGDSDFALTLKNMIISNEKMFAQFSEVMENLNAKSCKKENNYELSEIDLEKLSKKVALHLSQNISKENPEDMTYSIDKKSFFKKIPLFFKVVLATLFIFITYLFFKYNNFSENEKIVIDIEKGASIVCENRTQKISKKLSTVKGILKNDVFFFKLTLDTKDIQCLYQFKGKK